LLDADIYLDSLWIPGFAIFFLMSDAEKRGVLAGSSPRLTRLGLFL
jgi:hypothetical protein